MHLKLFLETQQPIIADTTMAIYYKLLLWCENFTRKMLCVS
jgi:hypothetical protein